jgi:hypothetical protein
MKTEIMTGHSDLLPTYRRLRQLGLQLNRKLVHMLSAENLKKGGQLLGIEKNGILVFGSEDESSVLMDYCIHNVRVDGVNAVQRYRELWPPRADSDDMVLLTAMLKAYYSIFQVVDAEHGVGVTVLDVLRGDTRFLVDTGLGTTARSGDILATRVLPLEEQGLLMSGGAVLPATLTRIKKAVDRSFGPGTDFARLTPDQEAELAAQVIRTCLLESGMRSRIVYGSAAERSSTKERSIDPRDVRRANRNDPCPCGSGQKFKSCCGRRPRL